MDILQWNVNGFFTRLENIKLLINQLTPTCICLQETNFSSDYCASLRGFEHFFKNRLQGNRASGGVAIFVKPYTFPEQVLLNTHLEACAVQIRFPLKVTICSVYLPNSSSLNVKDLNDLVNQLPIPFILLGDFNSHHYYWGSERCDTRGRIVADWLDSHDNIVLLNTDQPTHFDSSTGRTSNIDLTIASQNISSYFEWNAFEDLYDSDHFPILVKSLVNEVTPNSTTITKRWKFHAADWLQFREEIDKNIGKLIDLDHDSDITINDIVSNFSNFILEVAEKCIPKTSGTYIRKNLVPWWNEECKIAIKEAKKAQRLYYQFARNDHDSRLKIDYKKKRSKARRILKDSSRIYWEKFISSINSQTPIGTMWKKIQKINKKNIRWDTIVLQHLDGILSADPVANADLLAETFASNSSSINYDQQFIDFKASQEDQSKCDITDNSNNINKDLSMHELLSVLPQLGNTSPGPDNIPNAIIKHLPMSGLNYLLNLYNYIWKKQVFPDSWREALVIPILKPGKIPSSSGSYRPISLTCNLCKIFEKIISKRLRWYLESNNLLSPFQYGFRQNRSTIDCLMNIENDLLNALACDNSVIAVTLDIEKAYEMVWKHRVLELLQNLGIKGNTLAFVKNFLSNRFIRVRINNFLSKTISVENGLPQGSVLSVILFLIAINDVLTVIDKPVKSYLFADDLTITCSGRTLEPTAKLIQNTLNNLQKWSSKTGFKFSKTKTEFIIFTKKINQNITIELSLNEQLIKEVNNVKILGLTFDKKMTWKTHINKLKSECNNRLNIIKTLSSLSWGSDRNCLLNTYRSIIRQKIDYGSVLYDSANIGALNSLESVQNTALRLSIGAFRTSPVNSILAESGEMPLKYRRRALSLIYTSKILSRPDCPTYDDFMKQSVTDDEFNFRPSLHQPFKIRVARYLKELNFTIPALYPIKLLTVPPWEQPQMPINLELAENKKSDTAQYIYKNLFNELNYGRENCKTYYTDGSVMDDKSGCAVISSNNHYNYRLHDFSSIFTCEAIAILKTIELIETDSNLVKHVIYTDAKSCLMALQNPKNSHPLVLHIKQKIIDLLENHFRIELIWIPGHQGILGNEKADIEAKNATKNQQIDYSIKSSYPEVKKLIKSAVQKYWNNYWKSGNSSGLSCVRESVFKTPPILFTCRRDQIAITRLRIGHTNLTHCYLITKTEKNKCDKCGLELTVSHILIECLAYKKEKDICSLPNTLNDCLNDGYLHVLKFVKLIDIYKKL
jgi:ribonuclease HI